MMTLNDLSRAIAAYQSGQSSLDQFADWFRSVSRRKFAEPEEVRNAILEIDSTFSRLEFEGLSEREFRQELANAVRPFASRERAVLVRYNERPKEQRVAALAAAAAIILSVPLAGVAQFGAPSAVNTPAVLVGNPSVGVASTTEPVFLVFDVS
jgi:hypothetical protein